MGFLLTVLAVVVGLLGSLLILRAYLWSLAISPRDPLVRFAWKLTDWLVNPVAYLVKPRGNWDLSSLAAALILAVAYTVFTREFTGLPATVAAFVAMPVALLVRWGVDLLIWGTIIYCIMSFTSARNSGTMALMATMIDPFLRPFRRFIPRIGGFDLSPIVLFLLLTLVLRFVAPVSAGILMF